MFYPVFDNVGNQKAWALAVEPDKLDHLPDALKAAFDTVAVVDEYRLPRMLYVCITLDELARITGGSIETCEIATLARAFSARLQLRE